MRSKKPNRQQGKTLQATILDSYQEYVNLGYPGDPSVYVIRSCPSTLKKISCSLNDGVISKRALKQDWGFQMEEDPLLPEGSIVFGPEQIIIKWDGK